MRISKRVEERRRERESDANTYSHTWATVLFLMAMRERERDVARGAKIPSFYFEFVEKCTSSSFPTFPSPLPTWRDYYAVQGTHFYTQLWARSVFIEG